MKQTYVGIADCHGIDMFMPIKEANISILTIRADANAHRHALVFRVDLTNSQAEKVLEMLKNGNYEEALNYIKKYGSNIQVQKQRKKSWNMIPNPDLDPWR